MTDEKASGKTGILLVIVLLLMGIAFVMASRIHKEAQEAMQAGRAR